MCRLSRVSRDALKSSARRPAGRSEACGCHNLTAEVVFGSVSADLRGMRWVGGGLGREERQQRRRGRRTEGFRNKCKGTRKSDDNNCLKNEFHLAAAKDHNSRIVQRWPPTTAREFRVTGTLEIESRHMDNSVSSKQGFGPPELRVKLS